MFFVTHFHLNTGVSTSTQVRPHKRVKTTIKPKDTMFSVRKVGATTVSSSTLIQSQWLKIQRKNANNQFRTTVSAKFLREAMFVEKSVTRIGVFFGGGGASDTKVCGPDTRVVHSVTGFWVQLVGFQASRCNDKLDTAWLTVLRPQATRSLVKMSHILRSLSEMFHRRNDRIWPPDKIINSIYPVQVSPLIPLLFLFYFCFQRNKNAIATVEWNSISQLWRLIPYG